MEKKTHYRKAFDSPYLSAADIVAPTVLTVARVALEIDKTKKTKEYFNTAYFAEREIRPGEELKPMVLNATNSRTMKNITGTPFIEEWLNIPVTIYVDNNVRFGNSTVEGLRISTERPNLSKRELTPDNVVAWEKAVERYRKDGNLVAVLKHMVVSEENQLKIIEEAKNVA